MRLFSGLLNNNPLTRWVKNQRNALINDRFKKRAADRIVVPSDWIPENRRAVVFSIAFNKTVCVEVMIESWKLHARNTDLVIVDNSSKPQAREEIEALCAINNIPYIGLPKNPEWNQNRSHALGLNWTYYNLVLKWKPEVFGFLDFDCFPFVPFDLKESMGEYNIMGPQRFSKKITGCWNLWPGFAFYRLSRVQPFPLNFTHSIELRLDTGGLNWKLLYSKLSPHEGLFVDINSNTLENISQELNCSGVLNKSFLHLGSAGHKTKIITRGHVMGLLKKLNDIALL